MKMKTTQRDMRKVKRSHKILAIFLNVIMLNALLPYNMLYANNNGPTAPEATAFEPVDATDMVNLATGDLSYVLPLLNVPSPEGGYPLALSYHAGIAVDQEASWVGLGWSLNPGAINRSVNGYPDDYNNSLLTEYFYDEGDEQTVYTTSIGYSLGAVSTATGLSWGSHKSLGGYVRIDAGLNIGEGASLGGSVRMGTDGISGGVGFTSAGGLSLGLNGGTNQNINGSIGFNSNGTGFGISTNGAAYIDIANRNSKGNTQSLGLTLSSNGISAKGNVKNGSLNSPTVDGGLGTGINLQFSNTVQMGEYTTNSSGWSIPLFVPTPAGIFSLSFGKQKFKYYLSQKEKNYVNGSSYFMEGTLNKITYNVNCTGLDYYDQPVNAGFFSTENLTEAQNFAENTEINSQTQNCQCTINEVKSDEAFMDIYEIPLENYKFAKKSKADFNNLAFPNYDKYNIQAQGLSGNMSAKLYDNGQLYGKSNKETNSNYELNYAYDGSSTSFPSYLKFTSRPKFYFENEISSYLKVENAIYNDINGNSNIFNYHESSQLGSHPRQKNSNYVKEFYTQDLADNLDIAISEGYILPYDGFDPTSKPLNSISAFTITSADGKTYHYSLPVYNNEVVTRTFGIVSERVNENQSYFEKRQLEPYVTHWLLTAVTGQDYIDKNQNGLIDEFDLGYWVKFDYGKWSDAYLWKNPYGKDYFEDEENNDIKTWIRGTKEIYFLDRIKTRTHTALFIKSEREDSFSDFWNYKSVRHHGGSQSNSNFQTRFSLPSQKLLRLDKILLIKNDDDILSKSSGMSNSSSAFVNFNDSSKPGRDVYYNLNENVVDSGDNVDDIINNAIKVINFKYDYSLANGSPNSNSGRLTLNSVNFNGKGNVNLIPSYDFEYEVNNGFNLNNKDDFGYDKSDRSTWSLTEIITPEGGKINIDYESHVFMPVMNSKITFAKNSALKMAIYDNGSSVYDGYQPQAFVINSDSDFGINIGDKLEIKYSYKCTEVNDYSGASGYDGVTDLYVIYDGLGTITQKLGENKYFLLPDNTDGNGNSNWQYDTDRTGNSNPIYWNCDFQEINYSAEYFLQNPIEGGGIRASKISVSDFQNEFSTLYDYGVNNSNIGYISYLPFAPELQDELPYSSELPSPRVMYEHVSVESLNNGVALGNKTRYKFKVLKSKSPDKIEYGDLYKINVNENRFYNSTADVNVSISEFTVEDNLSTLGQLLSVESFNSKGQLLNKIINEYYLPGETPNLQGVVQESYQSYKKVNYDENKTNEKDKWLINSTTRIKYPALLKMSKEYKSNFSTTTNFGELDPITGESLEILTETSDGLQIKTKAVPAYTKYPEMGSKVDNINNKNMLVQNAGNLTQINVGGIWKTIGADITTWNNNWTYYKQNGSTFTPANEREKIWRKHQNYVWKGPTDPLDGSYLGYSGDFDGFVWGIDAVQTNTDWFKVSTTKTYDHYSMPLEVYDVNNNYASTKMGDNETKVFSVSNAPYMAHFYSGAEDFDDITRYFGGQVSTGTGASIYTTNTHSGLSAVQANANAKAFIVKPIAGDYRASVWVKKNSGYANTRLKVGGGAEIAPIAQETVFAGDWVQYNFKFTQNNSSNEVYIYNRSTTGIFDDFRVYPVESSLTSYVYNEWDELTHILGANNMGTRYEYDEAGRLRRVFAEVQDEGGKSGGFKLAKEINYNYKRVAELDTNGNGILEPTETYDPLSMYLLMDNPENYYSSEVKATASGGSGNYQYRWAQSTDQNNLTYGNWSTQSVMFSTLSCPDTTKYIKCQVKDIETGNLYESTIIHFRDCSGGGGGPIIEPSDSTN